MNQLQLLYLHFFLVQNVLQLSNRIIKFNLELVMSVCLLLRRQFEPSLDASLAYSPHDFKREFFFFFFFFVLLFLVLFQFTSQIFIPPWLGKAQLHILNLSLMMSLACSLSLSLSLSHSLTLLCYSVHNLLK